MIILASITDLVTVASTSLATIDVQASGVDLSGTTVTPWRQNTAISTISTTTVTSSPAAATFRNLKDLTVKNRHATLSSIITITHTDGATAVEIFNCALAPGEQITLTDTNGFQVFDSTGALKTVAAGPGRFLKTTLILTGTTTFTTQPLTTSLFLRMVGGGGQGGGSSIGSAGVSGAAGGGAAGGYAEKTFAVAGNTTYVCAVGAKGTGSGAGNTTGTNGGATSFTVGATTVTANGGAGGAGVTAAAAVTALGGTSATQSTNGDVNGSGEPGNGGFVSAAGVALAGKGGSGIFGGGGQSLRTQATGQFAKGFGAGGGGACAIGAVAAVAGGDGTDGLIVAMEYA